MTIKKIKAREILDSRGFPTIECSLELSDGLSVKGSVPSGASTGMHEAKELRDGDEKRFCGKGVLRAIDNIENKLGSLFVGKKPDLLLADKAMIELDGTDDKSRLGANTLLAVSMAVCRAQAHIEGLELYQFITHISGIKKISMPQCMFNVINGGVHAQTDLSIQEIMITPEKRSVSNQVETAATIYHTLKRVFNANGYDTDVGDEGGFAPFFNANHNGITAEKRAIDCLMQAIHESSREYVSLALDVAASEFYDKNKNAYFFNGHWVSTDDLIILYEQLSEVYPISLIEDGCAQDDWIGWKKLQQALGSKISIVGDDLFVTNAKRIILGIDKGVANTVLIKPNQVGTITEALEAIRVSREAGYKILVSHRSGETNDTFIADFAVGVAADFFKAGAPARGERVSKYNRLMKIESDLWFK